MDVQVGAGRSDEGDLSGWRRSAVAWLMRARDDLFCHQNHTPLSEKRGKGERADGGVSRPLCLRASRPHVCHCLVDSIAILTRMKTHIHCSGSCPTSSRFKPVFLVLYPKALRTKTISRHMPGAALLIGVQSSPRAPMWMHITLPVTAASASSLRTVGSPSCTNHSKYNDDKEKCCRNATDALLEHFYNATRSF